MNEEELYEEEEEQEQEEDKEEGLESKSFKVWDKEFEDYLWGG